MFCSFGQSGLAGTGYPLKIATVGIATAATEPTARIHHPEEPSGQVSPSSFAELRRSVNQRTETTSAAIRIPCPRLRGVHITVSSRKKTVHSSAHSVNRVEFRKTLAGGRFSATMLLVLS